MENIYNITEADRNLIKKFFDDLQAIKNNDDIAKFYEDNINIYKTINTLTGYRSNGVYNLARKLFSLFEDDISDKTIIDIGAGTGSLGEDLNQLGFRLIDGLDISKVMLDRCREKNIYRTLYEVPLTCSPTKGIEDSKYDAAISVGCFVEGHIPLDALEELSRMVKPGGYIVYSINDPQFKMNYMEIQGRFMKEKKLQLISMELLKYKREITLNFEFIYAYQVVFKVL